MLADRMNHLQNRLGRASAGRPIYSQVMPGTFQPKQFFGSGILPYLISRLRHSQLGKHSRAALSN